MYPKSPTMKKLLLYFLLLFSTNCFAQVTYSVSSIPYAPDPYNAGIPVPNLHDDTYSSEIPIGFDFSFFGLHYDSFLVSSNASISFNLSNSTGYAEWYLDSVTLPSGTHYLNNSILGPYVDIDISQSAQGNINTAVYGSAPYRRMVISFDSIAMFNCNNLFFTGQIVLYERTWVIDVIVKNKPTCLQWNNGKAILGIQSSNDSIAYVAPFRNGDTVWTTTNESWRFTPSDSARALNVIDLNKRGVRLSPNPAHNEIRVSLPRDMQGAKAEIWNASGSKVFSVQMSNGEFSFQRNDLPDGLYFLTLQTSNRKEYLKFILN